MNFADFWAQAAEIGYPTDEKSRNLAMGAWDAALCAAQAQNFAEAGQMRSNLEMSNTLSELHTWHQATPPATLS